MSSKKNKGTDNSQGSDAAKDFGDLEDSFFASGDDTSFWSDENVSAYQTDVDTSEIAPVKEAFSEEAFLEVAGSNDYVADDSVASGDDLDFFASGPPSEEAPLPDPVPVQEPVPEAQVATAEVSFEADDASIFDLDTQEAASPELGSEDSDPNTGSEFLEPDPTSEEELPEAWLPGDDEEADDVPEGSTAAVEPTSSSVAMDSLPSLAPYVPPDGETAAWREAVQVLLDEASSGIDSAEQAELWSEAGRFLFARVGDWDGAEQWIAKARDLGPLAPEIDRILGHVLASRGDFEGVLSLLEGRAEGLEGIDAAEALDDAGLVARNNLQRPERAVELLERAREAHPGDWFALRLLREIHERDGNWNALAQTLGEMADLLGGSQGAGLQVERGRLFENALQDDEKAKEAYQAALRLDPSQLSGFVGLERITAKTGEPQDLVDLYRAQLSTASEADARFWKARIARALSSTSAADSEVVHAWEQAIGDSAEPELRREQQGWLKKRGLWADMAASLEAEAGLSSGAAKAFALVELARIREGNLADQEGAIEAWRGALAADPAAGPARDAIVRLLGASGRFAELLEVLTSYVESLTDPNMVVTTLYRMGEICEGPLSNQEGARAHFEQILDTAPGYLPALEGLERVYTRLAAWDQLGAIYEQRAVLSEEPAGIALQLHRAGAIHEFRLADHKRARDFYSRALSHVADFPPSLDAFLRILEKDGDWSGLAQVLVNAAEVSRDSNEVVSLTYRSARVLADCVDDREGAMVQLKRCLELSPGFLPAIGLLRELSAATEDWDRVLELQRQEADGSEDAGQRHWRLMAAAEAAEMLNPGDAESVVREILLEDESHPGALRFLEAQAWNSGDLGQVARQYQAQVASTRSEADRLRGAIRAADLGAFLDDTAISSQAISEVAGAAIEGGPAQAIAAVAESLGYWEHAQRVLGPGDESRRAVARLGTFYKDDPARQVSLWKSLLESAPDDLEAAASLERALGRLGSRDGLAEAHMVLAKNSTDTRLQAVHGLLAGHLFESASRTEEASEMYRVALGAQPSRGKAFDALLRTYRETQDREGLRQIFLQIGEGNSVALADALHGAGDAKAAVDLLGPIVATEDGVALGVRLRLERALEDAGDWRGAFEALGARREVTRSETSLKNIEDRRRWILAEKLADTDEAWDFYRQLHEEDPEDSAVLEALAQIASARGNSALAIQYLEGLSSVAPDNGTRARYFRRIAAAHQRGGDPEKAQTAYHQALDLMPEDRESIAGLKVLAQEAQAWSELVRVLAREASVEEGEAQVQCYREIASLWEEKLDKPKVAIDAWRKVLELAAGDVGASQKLVALCRASEDWEGLFEHGQSLLSHGEGGSALKAELGALCLDQIQRPQQGLELLTEAMRADTPSLEAAVRLENYHLARGTYDLAVDAIRGQARASEGKLRISHLLRAAHMLKDTLRNREAAAAVYAEVLSEDGSQIEAVRYRADFLYESGDYTGAIDAFEGLLETESRRDLEDFDDRMEVALYFYRFGDALRQTGELNGAAERFRGALKANPNHLPSLDSLGPILVENESWEEARDCYRQLLQLTGGQGDPGRLGHIYGTLGKVELALGSHERARKRIGKALEYLPDDVGVLQAMADVVFQCSEWHNVLGYYNKIIAKAGQPDQVIGAFLMKSYVLDSKLQLTEKANQHYLKSLAFDGRQPRVLLRLAELSLREKDWPRAGEFASRGLDLAPEDSDVLAGLHLALSTASFGCGDSVTGQASLDSAWAADASLKTPALEQPDRTVDVLAGALRERLMLRP